MKKTIVFAILFYLTLGCFAFGNNIPKANPKSEIVSGNVRFTILTPELIRLEWAADGIFEDRASQTFVNRNLVEVPFKIKEHKGWLTIKTEKLTLNYKTKTGRFTKDNLNIRFILNGKTVKWSWGDEDKQNLLGAVSSLDQVSNSSQVKFENGLVSRGGWTFVDDSNTSLFDGDTDWNWVIPRENKDFIDCYFFGYGHNYSKAINDYTKIAGKVAMPPRYAFGYWWSRYWAFSDGELKDLVIDMERNKIPMDVVILDMDWHTIDGLKNEYGPFDIMGQRMGWTGYTWNNNLFPNPDKLLNWMGNKGIKNAVNIHPASGIMEHEESYPRMVKALGLDTSKDFPYDRQFAKYAGWNTVSVGKNIVWDITNKKFAKSYFNEVMRPLEKQGVDFFWLDWQQWPNTPIKGLSNIQWINYTFYTDMEKNSGLRPMLFHRWGGLGNHRYPIGFSGDTRSNWNVLDFQKYFTATAANVAYSYWSNDIGGHVYTPEFSPELYTRWMQFGVFSPILRTHATKKPDTERKFWLYPYPYFDLMREAIQLRYALFPYIYTASRHAFDTGEAICLPMYYKYPDRDEAYDFKGQYYFGQDMIAAPVTDSLRVSNDLAPVKFWLPEGEWFDWATGSMTTGDKTYDRQYSLSQIPIFVKSGAIIPMFPYIQNLDKHPDLLVLKLFPGEKGSTTYYEDDGTTNNYKKEEYSRIEASQTISEKTIHINIRKIEQYYKSCIKSYRLDICNSVPPANAKIDGMEIKWEYDPKTFTTSLFCENVSEQHEIVVTFDEDVTIIRDVLNTLKGKVEALNEVMETLKQERARLDWGALPPFINQMYGISDRITYKPQEALTMIRDFKADYPKLINEVSGMGLDNNKSQKIISRLQNEL